MKKRSFHLLNILIACFLISIFIITYVNSQNLIGIQSGTIYRQYKISGLNFADLIGRMIIPIESEFLISVIDIFPYKVLELVFPEKIAYSLSVSIFFVGSLILFYKVTRRTIPTLPSVFLTTLLFLTPTLDGFHKYLARFGSGGNRYSGYFLMEFPFPIGVIFGLSLFAYLAGSQNYSPKIKYRAIGIALVLQVYIHPLNAFVCGAWLIWDFFKNPGSPKLSHLKSFKLLRILILLLLLGVQTFSILFSSSYGNFGGITGDANLSISKFDLIFFSLLPLVLIEIARKFINISWYEIISRFSFISALFIFKLFAICVSLVFDWDNLYEVLSRNGYVDFIDVIIFIPVIYSLTAFDRANKIVTNRSRAADLILAKSRVAFNFLVATLLSLVVLQSSDVVRSNYFSRNDACLKLNDSQQDNLREIVVRSGELSESILQNELQNFTLQEIPRGKYRDFLREPFGNFNRPEISELCGIDGLGYLVLNGFEQDNASMIRMESFLKQLEISGGDSVAN